jgi:hypothetical protein
MSVGNMRHDPTARFLSGEVRPKHLPKTASASLEEEFDRPVLKPRVVSLRWSNDEKGSGNKKWDDGKR